MRNDDSTHAESFFTTGIEFWCEKHGSWTDRICRIANDDVKFFSGIPDKVKAGQEIITSAVGGLLFIIFAVVMMNLIGVKILNIPGL